MADDARFSCLLVDEAKEPNELARIADRLPGLKVFNLADDTEDRARMTQTTWINATSKIRISTFS